MADSHRTTTCLLKTRRRAEVRREWRSSPGLFASQEPTAPRPLRGAAQFSADGAVLLVAQQEDGIGSGIGVEAARLEERLEQHGGQRR